MIPRRIGDWEMNPMPDIDQAEQGRTLCWEFLSTGRCPRGSSCGFLHRQRTLAPPPTAAPPPTPPPPLEENTVSSPSLVPGTPNYCDAFPPLQRPTSASARRRHRFHQASPPRASSPSSVDRDRHDTPPPSPQQAPCSFQRDDTLAAGTATLTAPVAIATFTGETTPGTADPTAKIIPTATIATTATADIRADSSPLDDGIENMPPGSSNKPPSRDGNPPPTSQPQTPPSSKRDDTIAAGSSSPTIPVTTVRLTGETTPTTANPAANITPTAAAATNTATADTGAALNDGIEIPLPGSSSDKPPSWGRNPPPSSPPHTLPSSQRDDTVAAGPSTYITTAGETTPTTACPTADIIIPTVTTITTTATADTRADYSPEDHGMPGWSSKKPPSRDGDPPPPSWPQTPRFSQRDGTVRAGTSTPITPLTTARPTGKTTPTIANIIAPATVTTTGTASPKADYSPLDDGIEIALPGWSSDRPPSREEVNAYIERFLYGPRRPRRKRLPVFEAICPSTPDDYKDDD